MVRIKITGPASTVRLQHAQPHNDLVSSTTTSSYIRPSPVRSVIDDSSRLTAQEDPLLMQKQQSLEMVKIMLHFGTLFYLREFLPLPCFDDRDLKETHRQQKFSYHEFVNGNLISSIARENSDATFGSGRRGQPLKILLRGSDPKTDSILDVLETGIFDAMSKRVLEAVQLTILVDKNAPDNVLESYTFSFKYTGGQGNLNDRLESISVEPVGYTANMKCAQTARVGLETIVRRLITLSSFLPTLPNKRNLGIHLFYTEDCPSNYEPPGFTDARDGTLHYPLAENWTKETQTCGVMDSGCHKVGLKVTSLKWTGPEPEGSDSLPQIPPNLEYKDTVPRSDDIGVEDCSKQQKSTDGGNLHEVTQDVAERERLRMMIPSQETLSSDTDFIPTQPLRASLVAGPDNMEATGQCQTHRFLLSRRKMEEIREYFDSRNSGALRNGEIWRHAVRCECGWEGEEKAMLECAFCHTRQHLVCYGYEGVQDPRIPDVHACYRCLLEQNESSILHEVKKLTLVRRTLRVILEEGYPCRTALFSEKTHCSGSTVIQITNRLRKEGFLQPTPGSKSKGFLRKGLPKFRVPHSEDIRQRMKREILDPMVKIQHHYTKQFPHDSLEAPSPPATDLNNLSTPNSQQEEISASGYDTENQGTQKSNDRFASSTTVSHNGKDKPSLIYCKPYVAGHLNPSTADTAIPTRKRTRSSQIHPEPGVIPLPTTPTHGSPGDGLRRSARKKRKISNYSKLIDVGAETSDSEQPVTSSQP
ncbi:hypothetical protein AOCH_002751 [Aspergillus ochraceoroseus]|uniref:HORMA domain-containing protein n=1 Tax=Aspergillus ochraceoroseus TaxID=138278 RepID=A0A0F8U1E9_9EURO|nr:hypothetical protein AOCH_002751 [Aspergillus ochraceoroseus]